MLIKYNKDNWNSDLCGVWPIKAKTTPADLLSWIGTFRLTWARTGIAPTVDLIFNTSGRHSLLVMDGIDEALEYNAVSEQNTGLLGTLWGMNAYSDCYNGHGARFLVNDIPRMYARIVD